VAWNVAVGIPGTAGGALRDECPAPQGAARRMAGDGDRAGSGGRAGEPFHAQAPSLQFAIATAGCSWSRCWCLSVCFTGSVGPRSSRDQRRHTANCRAEPAGPALSPDPARQVFFRQPRTRLKAGRLIESRPQAWLFGGAMVSPLACQLSSSTPRGQGWAYRPGESSQAGGRARQSPDRLAP